MTEITDYNPKELLSVAREEVEELLDTVQIKAGNDLAELLKNECHLTESQVREWSNCILVTTTIMDGLATDLRTQEVLAVFLAAAVGLADGLVDD